MEQSEAPDHLFRVTPLTYVLVVALALILGLYYWPGREAARTTAQEQSAIEAMVKETNDLAAKLQGYEDQTRALLDPLVLLAELERRYEAAGIRPLSAKQFTAELAAANKKLLAGSSGSKYIDTCAQKSEIEKHLLYDGLHGPVQALPGWTADWQTRCTSILPPA
jgi:hypothetical protein